MNFSEGLQKIGGSAFHQAGLEEILIPKSVTQIGGLAFGSCDYLKKVTFQGRPPEFGGAPFQSVSATVYYPGGFSEWEAIKREFSYTIQWEPYFCSVHTPVVIPGITATCEKTGMTDGKQCSVCGKFVEEQKGTPKAAHQYGPWQQIDSDMEMVQHHRYRTCTVCQYVDTETVYKPDNPDTEVTNPTEPQPTTPAVTDPTDATQSGALEETEPTAPTQPVANETTAPAESEPAGTQATEPKAEGNKTAGKTAALVMKIVLVASAVAAAVVLVYKKRTK